MSLLPQISLASLASSLQGSSQPSPRILICLVVPIVVAIVAVLLILAWHLAKQRQLLDDVAQYVRDLKPLVPDDFYGREFLRVCFTRLFDVPDNFLDVNEPSFMPIRLGWLIGMVELLGPTAELNFGYLEPAAHPGTQVLTAEFWLNFERDGQRWTIWYPDRDYVLVRRSAFATHIGTIHRRQPHAEIDTWLRRNGFADRLPDR